MSEQITLVAVVEDNSHLIKVQDARLHGDIEQAKTFDDWTFVLRRLVFLRSLGQAHAGVWGRLKRECPHPVALMEVQLVAETSLDTWAFYRRMLDGRWESVFDDLQKIAQESEIDSEVLEHFFTHCPDGEMVKTLKMEVEFTRQAFAPSEPVVVHSLQDIKRALQARKPNGARGIQENHKRGRAA